MGAGVEIVLVGDDHGVQEAALEVGAKHIRDVEKSPHGTPLLSSIFAKAQEIAANEILMYANADVMFFPDLPQILTQIPFKSYLVTGQRWDLEQTSLIDFATPDWSTPLKDRLKSEGKMHGPSGLDYFMFRKGSVSMPPFVVGRQGWDNWFIYDARKRGIPVIDATKAILIVHQNHDYSHSVFGGGKKVDGPELAINLALAGGRGNMLTLRDADWIMDKGAVKPAPYWRRALTLFLMLYPCRRLLTLKRNMSS